jgi:hypothetical protein
MNKSTAYANVMLTIIAALLGILAFRIGQKSTDAASVHILDVNIVSASKSLPVSIDSATSQGVPLEVKIVGTSKVVLSNPAKGGAPLGSLDVRLIGSAGSLPVVVMNPPEPAPQPKGPLDVNLVSTAINLPVFVLNPTPPASQTTNPIDINIVGIAGYRIPDQVGSQGLLPVNVFNTVNANIVSPLAKTSDFMNTGVGVVYLNH